ncbi:MAG: C40 family peptidase [Candidatus Neomarinimicrobiota bacterium]
MQKIIPLLILTCLLGSCQSTPESKKMNELNDIIQTTKERFAPDKRVALFDITGTVSDGKIILTGETNLPEAHSSLLAEIRQLGLPVEDHSILLPDPALGDQQYAIVRLSVANIRSQPAHSAELATQALLGTVLKVYKNEDYWYLVQTPDYYLGWVDASGIQRSDKGMADKWIDAGKIIFTADYGFATAAPKPDAERVSDLVAGDLLLLLGTESGHYRIGFPDGRSGYIPMETARLFADWLAAGEPQAASIIRDARRYIGLPYLWGGTSSKNFDCSGFTKTVFFLNGVILARDASQQVFTGHAIDTENGFDQLEPCDLLFFGKAATDSTRERITHVGLYLGDTEFIHASGLVKINSLDPARANFNQYRFDTFIRARRILTSLNENGIRLVKDHPAYVQVRSE